MTWRKNPREITDQHFSDGTTIDGNRLDNAIGDVVDNCADISHGYMRKRWVPVTYVAGWSPQSIKSVDADHTSTATLVTDLSTGMIASTHHWPWMRVRNYRDQVAQNTLGSTAGDDVTFSNPYRLKGARVKGVEPYGGEELTPVAGLPPNIEFSEEPIGEQYAWTRSWFIAPPSILDSIDLILVVDNAAAAAPAGVVYDNANLMRREPSTPIAPGDTGLVITAAVDSEFDREDRNMSDVEVLRRDFVVGRDQISRLPLPASGTTYNDFAPQVQNPIGPGAAGFIPGTTAEGVHVRLSDLNIPIHRSARLRVSVVIPVFPDALLASLGWGAAPFYRQQVNMTVTMLEEVMV